MLLQILNNSIYYGRLSIYCHSPFALISAEIQDCSLLYYSISAEIQNRSLLCYSISAAIQDCSLLCYSYRLRFKIAYCSVIHIGCGTGFLSVLLLPCLPSYLLLSVEKMETLSLPVLLLPFLPYIRLISDSGLTAVPDDRLADNTLILQHFFSPFIR